MATTDVDVCQARVFVESVRTRVVIFQLRPIAASVGVGVLVVGRRQRQTEAASTFPTWMFHRVTRRATEE